MISFIENLYVNFVGNRIKNDKIDNLLIRDQTQTKNASFSYICEKSRWLSFDVEITFFKIIDFCEWQPIGYVVENCLKKCADRHDVY